MAENDAGANLIINYLPQTLTDEEFRTMFSNIGSLKSCKIVRDKATNYSYGFGFVEYTNEEDAKSAIESLNGHQLQNKKIKVSFARPSQDDIRGANLYVSQIPEDYDEENLTQLFQPYGTIIQVRILKDNNTGVSKRTGFVLFSKKEEADAAIYGCDSQVPEGGIDAMSVKRAEYFSKKVPPGYVMYPPSFYGPGPVRSMGNRYRYNPMSYYNYNNYYYDPGMMGMPTGGDEVADGEGHVLYAYNIGYDANERSLWSLFANYGTISKVNVIYDHQQQQCKGYGFVTMTNYQDALCAIYSLNGYKYRGRKLQVSFHKKNEGNQ